jgi:gamma-glutamyltranspeptidase/glutathione hydrolase
MDAAVAVQAALTLVEPQSSGLGGGAFLLYFDARSGSLKAYDGRETAPASATPSLFLDEKGKPVSFPAALLGGRSVGVPGVVRMLALAHGAHGKLAWADAFPAAVALAERGFAVTPRLHTLLDLDPVLPAIATTRGYFFGADGWVLPVGARLANPALAETLRTIAKEGPDGFYAGPIAADLVEAVGAARRPAWARATFNLVAREVGVSATGEATVAAPGGLTAADLAAYKAVEREPLCVAYRRYRVCTPPPPSGGVVVLEALALLERFDLGKLGVDSPEALHLITEAERLAYADRDRWVADPGFVDVPSAGLIDAAYVRERGAAITPERSIGKAKPGTPPGAHAEAESGQAFEVPSTSHFVIVDGDGSVACMTSSIEFAFGAHVMARGFLLNNQLTDFSFAPVADGRPVQNAVAPGKRPRSSMSPILVFDRESQRPMLALGSPGGGRIIGYVLRALVGVLDGHLSPQEAVARPQVFNMNGQTEVEDVGWPSRGARDALVHALEAWGHEISLGQQNSGLHAVRISTDGLSAGIDPRREGIAVGE